jgi:hypothetical protein
MSPENISTEMPPSSISVVAALRDFGLRNAGTPLLIASTPVSAAQPCVNERSTSSASARPVSASPCASSSMSALGARTSSPSSSTRVRPQTIIVPMPSMNAYVGIANATPDSRTPRRLMAVSSRIATTANATLFSATIGISAPTLAAAAEIETATVSV